MARLSAGARSDQERAVFEDWWKTNAPAEDTSRSVDPARLAEATRRGGVVGTSQPGTPADPRSVIAPWLSQPYSATWLDDVIADLNAQGIAAKRASRAGGRLSDDKIQLADGRIIDLIGDVGGANRLQYLDESERGGTPLGQLSGARTWDENFSYAPWEKQFQAPDAASIESDPEFKARMAAGQQALERSASARGTLLTTGTLKNLQELGQQEAGRAYGNIYGRKLGEYQQQYGEHLQGRGNALEEYRQRYLQSRDTSGDAYRDFMSRYGIEKERGDTEWNRLFSLADLGYRAAGAGNAAGAGYAGSMGDLYTGQGNVNAAGRIGSANAYGQGLGYLANLGMNVATRSSYGRNSRMGDLRGDYGDY